MPKRRLLLVGWDAADWKVARPLMAAGEMPNLARIVSEGVSGNLATLSPPLSPMLWTSIATGKRPAKHGIHGFHEPSQDGSGVMPITTLGRTAKAVWNILNQNSLKPSVVGWWPSHPAEPIRGVMVSNFFHQVTNYQSPAPLPGGTVHPPDWTARLDELRTSPMSLPGEVLRVFVPQYHLVDQRRDHRLHSLGTLIAETMSLHAAATEVLEHADWDFAAVYYDSIDHFCHGFMKYHPPRLPDVDEESFAIYSPVIANAYKYHDAMLGRLLQLAGPETTVMVVSDHGFHPDALRPAYIPAEAAGPAVEHRHFGLLAMSGDGIRAGETIHGANVLDVAPTVLHLFGLPAGRDMDGQVLSTAFGDFRGIAAIDSWEDVDGDAGTHPPGLQVDASAAAEAMRQLVDLGYIAPPGANAADDIAQSLAEMKYNLARSHADAGEWEEALRLFGQLHAATPRDQRYAERTISALLATGQHERARQMLDEFDALMAIAGPEAAAELKRRREEKPDDELQPHLDRADKREQFDRRELMERSSGYPILRMVVRLRVDLAGNRTMDARRDLDILERLYANSVSPPAMLFAGACTRLRDDVRALQWIGRALERDSEDWDALSLAARIHLRNRRTGEARDAALLSLSLVYFQPVTHFVLGRSLANRGQWDDAEQAFRTALHQMPGFVPAHSALARLCQKRGKALEAALHRRHAAQLLKSRGKRRQNQSGRREARNVRMTAMASQPFEERSPTAAFDPTRDIAIVAGLPRSGTSMLMQLLAAGGIDPLTDGRRAPDSDNPRGYFEYEPATRLVHDASWLPSARGKVVKLALPLLTHLPPGESYRILIVEREPAEVIASQKVMLQRLGRPGAALDDEALALEFARQRARIVRWLARRQNVAVLPLRYDAILSNPHAAAARVASFLNAPLDAVAAAAAVEPALRRQSGL